MADSNGDNLVNNEADDTSSTDFAISKNFFDFEAMGSLDSDVDVIDEVESFCAVAKEVFKDQKKAEVNDICGQILNFFCSQGL